jgi:hypothetical protein
MRPGPRQAEGSKSLSVRLVFRQVMRQVATRDIGTGSEVGSKTGSEVEVKQTVIQGLRHRMEQGSDEATTHAKK